MVFCISLESRIQSPEIMHAYSIEGMSVRLYAPAVGLDKFSYTAAVDSTPFESQTKLLTPSPDKSVGESAYILQRSCLHPVFIRDEK